MYLPLSDPSGGQTRMGKSYSAEDREIWIKRILDAAEDGIGLKTICDELKFWRTTFLDWCDEDPKLDDRYKRARARGIRLRAEGLPKIAREAIGQPAEVVGAYRLLIDAEKWYISKILPKEFGEKIDATIGNPDGTPLGLMQQICGGLLAPIPSKE